MTTEIWMYEKKKTSWQIVAYKPPTAYTISEPAWHCDMKVNANFRNWLDADQRLSVFLCFWFSSGFPSLIYHAKMQQKCVLSIIKCFMSIVWRSHSKRCVLTFRCILNTHLKRLSLAFGPKITNERNGSSTFKTESFKL